MKMQYKNTIEGQINANKPPLWTQDESIAFECARGVMNHIDGICSSLIAKENVF